MAMGEESNMQEEITAPLIREVKTRVVKEDDYGVEYQNGHQWMVYLSTVVAVCGSFSFGSGIGYSSPTQSAIREDLNLSLAEYSLFGSIMTFGAMIGAITSGPIADFLGRKWAMRISSGFCVAGWLAIFFAEGALSLDIGRLATGYGMGVFSYVVPVFIAEIAPKNLRGALTTINQLMICGGVSVAFVLGTVLTWRALALTGLVPCAVLLFGLFLIPESPRWLAKVGHQKEFEAALHKLRGKDADISSEAAEIQDYIETLQRLPKAKVLDLFQRRYLRSVIVNVSYSQTYHTIIYILCLADSLKILFIPYNLAHLWRFFPFLVYLLTLLTTFDVQIGVGLMVFQQFGGINGISFYVSSTFESAGFPSNLGTIIYAILQVVITALGAILIDKAGRKPLLLVSASGLVLGCILTGTSFYLKAHEKSPEAAPILAVTGILVYIGSFSAGMGAIPWVLMSEIFPINIKGVAGSLSTLVNWFGAWAVSYTFNFLMSWSSYGTFVFYAAMNVLAILFVVKVVPETKGRTLEQIQAAVNA